MNPTAPGLPTDPSIWNQLGPVGGVLAFIVTTLWLFREYQFTQREKDWKLTADRQWQMLHDLARAAGNELTTAVEKSTAAMVELKTFVEVKLR